MELKEQAFWSISPSQNIQQLNSSNQGITKEEAGLRLNKYGSNILKPKKQSGTIKLLIAQYKSPIILILLFAAILSFFLHDSADTLIILTIVLISGLLGFWQEKGAANAVDKLLAIVQVKATILRNGKPLEISVEEVVPGDVVLLSAGGGIPGDCILLESESLFLDEAALTGETFPIEKKVGVLPVETPLSQRTNCLFMGTHVVSGSAKALVVKTGQQTEFGEVSQRLSLRAPETEFERGIKKFGYLLMEVTLILVIGIFAVNVFLKRPVLDSFLFALALAVGLTPQLLPAIISINLARGAKNMAKNKVIVKRLAAIENFGSMDLLCSDKTGTLTEGTVHIHSTQDMDGSDSKRVLYYAYLNSYFETGYENPIDSAVRSHGNFDMSGISKLDEVPYDFIRKRLSILISKDNNGLMITKGAFKNIIEVCSKVELNEGRTVDIQDYIENINQRFEELSNKGFRTLGLAYRNVDAISDIEKENETDMTFIGFLVLNDPLKQGIVDTIKKMQDLGVALKVITGDNHLVAANLGQQLGLPNQAIITGSDLHQMSDEALIKKLNDIIIFAEIEPNQKERIIWNLKKTGHVVGYMGDGINDASALHAADVGISVNSAVDVAKDAADIVLLEKDLAVLTTGIMEGRITFANTLKYVFMATSANFGNMFSMAGASLFLSFLPLLPKQILLTNLLTDLPEMTIATDSVDIESINKPRRWDIGFIRRFMITFGILSSIFDFLTFGSLLFILKSNTQQFRTGWFIESVISASMIVLVIRSRKPFFKSKPGKYLFLATIAVALLTLILPFTPIGILFGFKTLPIIFYPVLGLILTLYIISAEIAKNIFYKKVNL